MVQLVAYGLHFGPADDRTESRRVGSGVQHGHRVRSLRAPVGGGDIGELSTEAFAASRGEGRKSVPVSSAPSESPGFAGQLSRIVLMSRERDTQRVCSNEWSAGIAVRGVLERSGW